MLDKNTVMEKITGEKCVICSGIGEDNNANYRIKNSKYYLCRGCANMYMVQLKINSNRVRLEKSCSRGGGRL